MSKKEVQIAPGLKSNLKNIPNKPGIYMMLNAREEIIYIGKAKDLKARVRTYLNIKSWEDRPKLYFMMPKVNEIKALVTNSETEALILEANMVYKHQPKYNVTLKDDKKFPWLMITKDEKYPRIVPIRDIQSFRKKYPKSKNVFFGPYSDAGAMWEVYKIIKEGFKLRIRKKPLFKDRTCINYHLGLCSGPCQDLITHEDYLRIVKQVENFLSGKHKEILAELKSEMKNASANLEYEKAAKIRNTIQKIEKVLEKQIVISDNTNLNQDIFVIETSEKNTLLQALIIRGGKVISTESHIIKGSSDTLVKEALTESIKQYYTRVNNTNIPDEVILEETLAEQNEIEKWLTDRRGKRVTISIPKKGNKLELLKLTHENAIFNLRKINSQYTEEVADDPSIVLENLKNLLFLKKTPFIIECFDISHLGGTNTVASMVTFKNGKPDKAHYRKFNIQSLPLNKIDDFSSIKEVIKRRYSKLVPKDFPDLIIIDGGKGQLSTACEAIGNIANQDIISLAKKNEEVFKPGRKAPIILDKTSKELHLLQHIRDEAHRFAVSFQRNKRKI